MKIVRHPDEFQRTNFRIKTYKSILFNSNFKTASAFSYPKKNSTTSIEFCDKALTGLYKQIFSKIVAPYLVQVLFVKVHLCHIP